jgi:alpha-mannosidase
VKRLIKEGKLELLGGGTTVIDYNLPCGESAIRNHYYSIKYYLQTFGTRPKYADLPDCFGLPAQLPQILSQFGYEAITQYDRVFMHKKPIWRGLDGSQIVLWSPGLCEDFHYPDCYKYTACPSCHGEGCEICDGSGMDYSYDFRYHELPRTRDGLVYYAGPRCSTVEMLDEFATSDKEEYIMRVSSEETLLMENYPKLLASLCKERGIELIFMTHAELLEHVWSDLVRDVREDCVDEANVDARVEGNPVATGCYTSRIELKKKNRMLEQLVLSTEKLAALALPAQEYPHKTFERIWCLLSFLQFHDCVTASHCDASYEELLTVCRDIYSAAGRIRKKAMTAIEARTPVEKKEGWQALVVVNPTQKSWDDVPQTLVVRDAMEFDGVELCDVEGNALPVLSCRAQNNALDCAAEVTTRLSLPANGIGIVYWRIAAKKEPIVVAAEAIENEYFTVDASGVWDKKRQMRLTGPCDLSISYDWGHAWGRLAEENWRIGLKDSQMEVQTGDGWRALVCKGGYVDPEHNITSLRWTKTATLYDGVDKIFWRTEVDWNGQDTHLYADFPLNYDHGDGAYYEIPYGMLYRPDAIEVHKHLGIEDEWVAQNYVATYDQAQNISVVLYNKGTPGCRVLDHTMQLSLLRSPTVLEYANEGARDHGTHIFEYAMTVIDGKPGEADLAAFGLRYTTPMPSIAATVKEGAAHSCLFSMSTEGSSVQITAIKRDEAGTLIVRAYESCGQEQKIRLPDGMRAMEVDPLEEKELSAILDVLVFRPFEIKTVRIVTPDTEL